MSKHARIFPAAVSGPRCAFRVGIGFLRVRNARRGRMTGRSPEGLPVRKIDWLDSKTKLPVLDLSEEQALRYQRAAWQAVQEYDRLAA